jgi:hypothetical protein
MLDELIQTIEAQRNLMISVACGGQPIKEVEREYETRRTQIRRPAAIQRRATDRQGRAQDVIKNLVDQFPRRFETLTRSVVSQSELEHL